MSTLYPPDWAADDFPRYRRKDNKYESLSTESTPDRSRQEPFMTPTHLHDNFMKLLRSPLDYGTMDDDELSSEGTLDDDTEASNEEDEDDIEDDDETGVIQVKVEWAEFNSMFTPVEHTKDATVEIIQGPNMRVLDTFFKHAPPPSHPHTPIDDHDDDPGSPHKPGRRRRSSFPYPRAEYLSPHQLSPAEIAKMADQNTRQSLGGSGGFTPLYHTMSDLSETPSKSPLRRHSRSLLNEIPRPLMDVRVSGKRLNWMPDRILSDDSEGGDLELGSIGKEDNGPAISGERVAVLWDEQFDFDRLYVKPIELEENEIAKEQRELEETELLHRIEASEHLNASCLLSTWEGECMDVDKDAVLDADAILLLRIWMNSPPPFQDDTDVTATTGRPRDSHTGGQVKGELLGQCLIVIDQYQKIAAIDSASMVTRWHFIHSESQPFIGRVRVGLRFGYADLEGVHVDPDYIDDEDIPKHHLFEVELLTRRLFLKYDVNNDGYMARSEFQSFVTELVNVGGNIKALEDANDGSGCLGYFLALPDLDLVQFIKHRHTLLVVCFDRRQRTIKSTTAERMGVVVMSLLWSLSSNCLVEVYMHTSRMWQVVTITFVDTFGTTFLAGVFLVSHWTHCRRCWKRSSWGQMIPLLLFIIFLSSFSAWLLIAMSPSQLESSVYSFLPIWATSRVTEVFKLGTYWAFMVQYGASPSARKARNKRLKREKEKNLERERRARLLGVQRQEWWQTLRFPWQRQGP